jgi:hypothetical protein
VPRVAKPTFYLVTRPVRTHSPIPIRENDFDPERRTTKWTETEKLATFIVDNLRARMALGSAFMGGANLIRGAAKKTKGSE